MECCLDVSMPIANALFTNRPCEHCYFYLSKLKTHAAVNSGVLLMMVVDGLCIQYQILLML